MGTIVHIATLGVSKNDIPDVLVRSGAMATGFGNFKADYTAPNPPLPAFQTLVLNLASAQQLVPSRAIGAAAARNVQRDLLWSAMKLECAYVQSLVDSMPGRAVSLIQNAGLVVVERTIYQKPLLALSPGTQPGTIDCVCNLSLLIGTGTLKPNQKRFVNWQYTLDGKTFLSAPSTPGCKTTIVGMPLLTLIGVRVSLTNMHSVGAWSQVVTITLH